MKFFEVISIGIYFRQIAICIFQYSTWAITYKDFNAVVKTLGPIDEGTKVAFDLIIPDFFTIPELISGWTGKVIEWHCIEIMIWLFYILTMLIMLIKSRFF